MNAGTSAKVLALTDTDAAGMEPLLRQLRERGYATGSFHYRGLRDAIVFNELLQYADLLLLDSAAAQEELLRDIRSRGQIPVVVLSSACDAQARINCFEQGADDYVTKPFNVQEVVLRINAILKRNANPNERLDDTETITLDSLRLNRLEQSVYIDDQRVAITPLEFKLLWLLAIHRGEVLSKPFTYQAVLDRKYGEFDRGIDMHLSRIRKKLEKAGFPAKRLQTVHGRGYRLRHL